ncbi:gliding motility lipoprotein GldH [Tunicatimonas pelagia]|uniref:gliding motility lipoprotein GldH n=1 Tax=Tunicatimonas pelagia TaxID=931531 RepID=UPI002665FE79|nr:gliding motility lipoprotein GldH [Tunicatimonas pelagia]WKN43881.1 gliding motility lipoprotein GldH [Tunicatimonas pelagia]
MKLRSVLIHRQIYLSLLTAFLALAFVRCDDNRLYEENINFDRKVWAADSLPIFRFQVDEPEQTYNIYWNVRNTVAYPFRNLYLTYYLEDTLGHTLKTDLYEMNLFEPRTGEPYGNGLGDIFSHQILALPNYKFDTAGMYQIRLQQYMRRDTLPEILSVGVRIERAEAD